MNNRIKAILIFSLLLASANVFAGSCRQSGDTTYCDDGTTYRKSGDTTYGSDGTTYRKSGDTTYGSDGTTYRKSGDTTYCN